MTTNKTQGRKAVIEFPLSVDSLTRIVTVTGSGQGTHKEGGVREVNLDIIGGSN